MAELRQRRPTIREPAYLAWLRKQPCACGCGSPPPCDAAHLRASSLKYDKDLTGGGRKPDDRWALPLRHDHHMAQHRYGDEVGWWAAHGIDPFRLAKHYYSKWSAEVGLKALGGIVERDADKPHRKPAKRPKAAGRPPQTQRQRIQSRGFPKGWPKRKISSRGFR